LADVELPNQLFPFTEKAKVASFSGLEIIISQLRKKRTRTVGASTMQQNRRIHGPRKKQQQQQQRGRRRSGNPDSYETSETEYNTSMIHKQLRRHDTHKASDHAILKQVSNSSKSQSISSC